MNVNILATVHVPTLLFICHVAIFVCPMPQAVYIVTIMLI